MARSRRSRQSRDGDEEPRRPGRRSSRRGKPDPAPEEEIAAAEVEVESSDDEELLSDSALEEVTADEDSGTYESESAHDSRRGGRRSSRRSRSVSERDGQKSSRRSSRRELTPEERTARRAARLALVKVVMVVVVVAAALIGLLVVMRPDPAQVEARQIIAEVRVDLSRLDDHVESKRVADAESLYQSIEERLQDPAFQTYGPEMMAEIDQLLSDLRRWDRRIDRARNDILARRNLEELEARIRRMSTAEERAAPTIDLDQLLLDIADFRANPIDPKAGPMPELADRYQGLTNRLAGSENRIRSESAYRSRSGDIESLARIEVERFVTQRQYKRAYEILENYKAQHPNADFSGIERNLDNSARQSWDGVRQSVEDRMLQVGSDGVSAAMRENNRRAAREALMKVVNDYNDLYVRQARSVMSQHGL